MVIDVHAHAIVPSAMAMLAEDPRFQADRANEARLMGEASAATQRKMIERVGGMLTNLEARLEAMDRQGVDVQLVSPSPAHYCDWADAALARHIARTVNAGVAELAAAQPDRIRGLGFAPLHVGEEALVEAVGDLGLHGVEIGTFGAGGIELGDADLDPFWAKAAELGALIFVHPWGCTLGERLDRFYMTNLVGQNVEHVVAISNLILSGVLDRHPDVKIVFAHGGGYAPFHPGRLDHGWAVREEITTPREKPSSYLRRLWFDSLVYEPELLEALVRRVGVDRVLLGSDFPFDMGTDDPVGHVHACALADGDKRAICGENAAALLGLG